MLVFALLYLAFFGAVAFAATKGGRAERHGALWLFINVGIHTVLQMCGERSTTFHLAVDGIYATGLLPLAFFYVSWWIGVQTLIACAGFGLQAIYLLIDRPADQLFMQASNILFALMLLNLVIATFGSMWDRRRKTSHADLTKPVAPSRVSIATP